jgi:hypothetical protein
MRVFNRILFTLLLTVGCVDRAVVEPLPRTSISSIAINADSAAIETLAQGLAQALSDPPVRLRLLGVLRDAPTPRHALHLPSYIAGQNGRWLAMAIAEVERIPYSAVVRLAQSGPGLELVMTRPMDRVSWRGDDDLLVAASVRKNTDPSPGFANAYRLDGTVVRLAPLSAPRSKLLVVRSIETLFSVNPEADRQAAPEQTRQTISTKDEEYRLLAFPSSARLDEDPGGGGGAPVGHVLPSYFTTETCRGVGQDSDGDGLLDQCEYEFAMTFSPQLSITNSEWCGGREPYWAVSPTAGVYRSVTIFYALSYHIDCGSYSHLGDSEFLILRVDEYSSSGSWRLYNITMSAHWHTWYGDRTATYAASDIEYGNDVMFGRPLVWVSKGKHANYRSQSICNAAWWTPDHCGDSHLENVETLVTANIRQSYSPLVGWIYSRTGQPSAEKFWDTFTPFCGWQLRNSECATPYNDILYFYGF